LIIELILSWIPTFCKYLLTYVAFSFKLKYIMENYKITKDDFTSEVIQHKGLVLVDFWAEWCGPCKILGPILQELAENNEHKFKLIKVNVDAEPELAQQYGIMSIPTMKLFLNGEIVGEIVGAAPKQHIEDEINKHL
jgi:thioredoxin